MNIFGELYWKFIKCGELDSLLVCFIWTSGSSLVLNELLCLSDSDKSILCEFININWGQLSVDLIYLIFNSDSSLKKISAQDPWKICC